MHMTRKLISTGSPFEKNLSFSRAVVVDNMVFVSGCTGYDYSTMVLSDDIVEQTDQTFKNIAFALQEAGASFKDLVRVNYFVPDPIEFEKCWPVINRYLDAYKPACTVVCCKLVNDLLKIEIEVTAVKSN
jgi:enamine deaminase RidA (YjgF/YER057c/UK114 family)